MKKLAIIIPLVLAFSLGVNAQTNGKTKPAENKKTTTAPAKNSGGQVKEAPAKTTSAPAKKTAEDKPTPEATTHAFAKGDNIFNIGVGFGHFYGIFSGVVGYPSVSLSYEKVFYDFSNGKGAIGLGAVGGWWSGRYTNDYWFGYTSGYHANYSRWAAGARCLVHYDLFDVPRLDTYGGLNVGLYISTSHVWYTDYTLPNNEYNSRSTSIYPMYGFFVGARYYTGKSNKFGFFGELGYGLSVLRLGIALKM